MIAAGLKVITPSIVAVINISNETFGLDWTNRLLLRPWQLFEEENVVMIWALDS